MDSVGLFLLILFAAVLFGIIKHFYDIIVLLINYFKHDYFSKYIPPRPLKARYKSVLEQHFTFYKKLTLKNKKHFEWRVQKFIDMKEFIPRGTLQEVTDEMKALIAGTAIQITFGYPKVYFEHFWRILVYEDNYYSSITQQYHQGEVNMKGFIILSWRNFVQGFFDHTNGRNLGYHEMAHALNFENSIENSEHNFLDYNLLELFSEKAHIEMGKIRDGTHHFLRDYASTNVFEFFAVAVESFFERPGEFKKYDTQLYELTAQILKQDPLNDSRFSRRTEDEITYF